MALDKGCDHRGLYRSVYCSLWSDSDWKGFSPEEKLVFLNLRTSPLSNIAAIYQFWIEPIEEQTGLARDAIKRALDTLSDRQWIAIEDGVVWIRKGLQFDPNVSLQNGNHRKGVIKAALSLPRLQIVRDFLDFYGLEIPYQIPSRSHPEPIPQGIPHPYTDQDKDKDKDKDKELAVAGGKGGGSEGGKQNLNLASKRELLRQQARELGVK